MRVIRARLPHTRLQLVAISQQPDKNLNNIILDDAVLPNLYYRYRSSLICNHLNDFTRAFCSNSMATYNNINENYLEVIPIYYSTTRHQIQKKLLSFGYKSF